MKKSILFFFACIVSASTFASQPLRRMVTRVLADGTEVKVERRGDANFSWWQSTDGKCFEMSSSYALIPLSNTEIMQRRAMSASTPDGLGAYGTSGMGTLSSLGEQTIPVVMAAYSDMDFLPADDITKIDRFLNEEGYHDERFAVGSVSDYFRISSYGRFKPRFEVVAKVTLSNDHLFYGSNKSAKDKNRYILVTEAVKLAEEQGVDFSRYAVDGKAPLISVMHAGPGEQEDYGMDADDYIWAHYTQSTIKGQTATFNSYLLTNETMRDFEGENLIAEYMTGIGTYCHELGHALGLPDMYDVSKNTNPEAPTPGYWDIMDYQFMYDGFRPTEYSLYERSMLGWVNVEDLPVVPNGEHYILNALNAENTEAHIGYRVVNPKNNKEYFLFENRQPSVFYQSDMLGTGMLVWHILYDSNAWTSNSVNTNVAQQRVGVVAADGQWQSPVELNNRDENGVRYTYAGDLFPGYANVTTFDRNYAEFYTENDLEICFTNIVLSDDRIEFDFCNPKEMSLKSAYTPSNVHNATFDLFGRRENTSVSKHLLIRDGKKVVKINER